MPPSNRCDFRELCLSDREPDRIVSVTVTGPDGLTCTYPAPVYVAETGGGSLIDGDLWPPGSIMAAETEPGDVYEVFRGCWRRAGHRGRHGYPIWQRPLRYWRHALLRYRWSR